MSRAKHAAPPDQSFDCYADFYQNSAYNQFPQEHRQGGSLGARFLSVDQGPFDLTDSALPDLMIVMTRTPLGEVGLDAGDGLRLHRNLPGNTITVQPPFAEERFVVSDPHSLTVVALNQLELTLCSTCTVSTPKRGLRLLLK